MSDKKVKYVSLKEVVDKMLEDEGFDKPFIFREYPTTVSQDVIITEDAEFEILEPKQLPESNQSK